MPEVINPYDQSVSGQIEYDTETSIHHKVTQARKHFTLEAFDTLEERLECMRRFQKRFQEQKETAAVLLSSQTGKPVKQALAEIEASDARIAYFLEKLPGLIQPQIRTQGNRAEEKTYEPLGVIANISAWNYPFFIGLNVIVPALLAGNAVMYKASEFCPLTAELLAEQLWAAGFDPDMFQLIQGTGEQAQMLLDQAIDGVFFTGSNATGQAISRQLAGRLVRIQMELGGKDPIYVTDDVDIKTSAQNLADGAFYNSGQSCCAVERIYVHESIADEFIQRFKQEIDSFVIGDPQNDKTYFGPLTRPAQIEVLKAQVEDALAKGAQLVTGGDQDPERPGYFQPTVLTHVDHSMDVMQQESFGPIIGIMKVSNDEEARTLMADTDYGLTAGIYCRDHARARKLLKSINSGTVYINACDSVSPQLPWSGRRQSGLGSTLGEEGIMAFVQPKSWQIRN